MKTVEILGKQYIFDHRQDQILKHGLSVPYIHSKEEDRVILSPYIFWSKRIQAPFVVPTWMLTDGASTPNVFRNVFPRYGRNEYPAYAHDFLYALYGVCKDAGEEFGLTRRECDLIFKDLCKLVGVGFTRINLAYSTLRVAGWNAYNKTGPMFIPKEDRQWYVDQFPELKLSVEDGVYLHV